MGLSENVGLIWCIHTRYGYNMGYNWIFYGIYIYMETGYNGNIWVCLKMLG